nr:sororin [Misgurnus anguillicaudatus]XP_055024868.1 sororin [Misgurnus anguillicaudatus]
MSNKTPRSTSRESIDPTRKSNGGSPPRRRSSRLSANDENLTSKVVAPPVAVKRSICVRKIAPRKTQASSESNKENAEKLLEMSVKKSKTLTPAPDTSTARKTTILSPILPPSSPSSQLKESEQDLVWSQRVRRSYSQLSVGDKSFESPKSHPASSSSSPNSRENLFGFERLQTPEVMHKKERSRVALQSSMSFSMGSFNISAADDSATNPPEVDTNIPGVCMVKKTKRKRVQQIKMSELDDLAAQMNAEFEEAEKFELVTE